MLNCYVYYVKHLNNGLVSADLIVEVGGGFSNIPLQTTSEQITNSPL
jgi:hypothetical protein